MPMESKESVELALRAAHVAQEALELLNARSRGGAKVRMASLAQAVMELDKFIKQMKE